MNICLLGDSILDNAAYTGGEPPVVAHLSRVLGSSGRATLLAVDGSITREVTAQLRKLPPDASHVVVSTGGNDALAHQDLLWQSAPTAAHALSLFGEPLQALEADYRRLLDGIRATRLPALCCTIYNGWMDDPTRLVVPIALSLFNDVLFRLALEYDIPVLDLRRVCTMASDYANPIEPSGSGGEKIARAIAERLGVAGDRPEGRRQRDLHSAARTLIVMATVPQGGPMSTNAERRRFLRSNWELQYTSEPVNLPELSYLLFAAQGVQQELQNASLRPAPSAGPTIRSSSRWLPSGSTGWNLRSTGISPSMASSACSMTARICGRPPRKRSLGRGGTARARSSGRRSRTGPSGGTGWRRAPRR